MGEVTSAPLRVLVVEDSEDDVLLLLRELKRGGFDPVHERVETAEAMRAALQRLPWDVVISDHAMPNFNALAALEILKESGCDLPFIIVSGTIGEETAVAAMKAGAHDFLMKGHLTRLVPSIEREIREARIRRERTRVERVQNSLLKFSQEALTVRNLEQLYKDIHALVSELMPAENFYIALYDGESDTLSFPYYVDEYDPQPQPQKPGHGLTEYVLSSGEPCLFSREIMYQLIERDEIQLLGTLPLDWLGAPLILREKPIGILAVQSYTQGVRYGEEEKDILTFISTQTAMAIERVRSEKALRESESRFRDLASNSPDIIFIYDNPGRDLAYFNRTDLLGYELKELSEEPSRILKAIYPEDQGAVLQHWRDAKKGEGSILEFRFWTKSGDLEWLQSRSRGLGRDSNGGPTQLMFTLSVITERKRAEEALKAESTFRKAIEVSILAGINAVDLEGCQSYVNPAFCRMVGWSEAELLGAGPPFVYWPPEEIEYISDAFRATMGEDALPSDFELRFQRRNGDRFEAYILVSPLIDHQGQITGWLSSVYDITERKRAEEALRKSEENHRRQTARAEALARTASRLNNRLDLQVVLETVCEEVARALNAPASSVMLFDKDRQVFYMANNFGFPRKARELFNEVPLSFLEQVSNPEGSITVVQNVQEFSEFPNAEVFLEFDVRTVVVASMIRDGVYVGGVLLYTIGEERHLSEDELTLMAGLADQAAQAIVNAQLFEEIERRLHQVHALRSVDMAIGASLDLRVTLDILLDQIVNQLDVDAADVLLFNPSTQVLEFAVGRGFRTTVQPRVHLRLGEGYASQAIVERRLIQIPNLSEAPRSFVRSSLLGNEGFVTYFGVPLIAKGQIKGVLEIFQRSLLAPDVEWIDFLDALAGQAAIAIDNASLFDQLQRSNEELTLAYDNTLEGWTRALDLRDRESEGHTQRVTKLTLHLAQMLGVRDVELIHVRRGALLHDIGKIGVPDNILNKPGKLTEEEWELVRLHPTYAFQVLSPIAYLRPALDIPYCHHERWDGTGYPRQLKGEQIPLSARIFAIVDVWDSLGSKRPYRPAWSKEEARAYIIEQSGKHFDPRVVEVFLSLLESEEGEAT